MSEPSGRTSRLSKFLLLFACSLICQQSVCAQVKPVRRILILYESSPSSPLPNLVDPGIESTFKNSPYLIEFNREYMETASFPDPSDQQMFRDYYVRKYRNRKPNVVIAVGPSALQFMLETHKTSFADVPVVFCLPNRVSGDFTIDSDFTGIEADIAPAQTLAAALRLQPGTMHVVVVSGTSPFDRQQNAVVKEQLRTYERGLNISYLTDLAMPDLLERLKRLPNHTIVILGALGRDAAGSRFTFDQAGPMVVAAANAPVFTLNDRALNHGEVGGDVSSTFEQGKNVGAMALRLLNGEEPRDVPALKNEVTYMFDWRALKHWGMKESNLPLGSILLNRPPSFWDAYKRYIVFVIFLFCTLLLMIGLLLRFQVLRARAQEELARSHSLVRESEERFRLVANTAPVTIWMTDADNNCTYANQHWLEFTGRSLESQLGMGWTEQIHPDDLTRNWENFRNAQIKREPFRVECRTRRYDGEYRWMLAAGVPRFNKNGSFAGYIGSAFDITERKLAEEALSSVSQKLVDAHEQERTWLARELHDDINQRLSLLAVSVDSLRENLPDSAVTSMRQTEEVGREIADVLNEIQSLSHRLHSSKLDLLGLEAAIASFCKDVSSKQRVEIDFHSANVPRKLPNEVALSLFRVLQEGLQNAIKHSGSTHFLVSLNGSANWLELKVQDSGIGFEERAIRSQGLGLTSMKERMRLIDGQLSIESRSHQGTTIRARVGLAGPMKVSDSGIFPNQQESKPVAGCVKVLVVEDYEPFRRFVCAALQRRAGRFEIAEASDGLEAVRKAEELQPDLILLDLGLPKLHGFEVAKQMRSLAPQARLLFVSQESSSEVIQEAFRLGGQGYVHKSHGQTDLMPAIDTVLRGEQFIGSGLHVGGVLSAEPRLVIAEDHPAMREMIAKILGRDFDVIATVETGFDALEAVNKHHPDVLVIDVSMVGLEGTDVAKQLTNSYSKVKIVFVSASMDAAQITFCLEAGGHAYVSKMRLATDLITAVRKVISGEGFVSALSEGSNA